jgi:hypothetical protein
MKKLFKIFFILITFSGYTQEDINWVVIPKIQVGDIKSNCQEKDLITIFGQGNIIQDSIYIGDGEFRYGSILFPNTENELKIIWESDSSFKDPKSCIFHNKNSNWITNTGIRIGTTLKELEDINDTSFILLGFGWGYGGTVVDWKNGKLKQYSNHNGLHIRLSPSSQYLSNQSKIIEDLSGDIEIHSSNEKMQEINPEIFYIEIRFD